MQSDFPVIPMPLKSLMLAILFVPEILFFLKLGSSAALGVASVAMLVLLVALSVVGFMRDGIISGTWIVMPLLTFITVHLIAASTFLEVDFVRAFASFAPLYLMIVGGLVMGNILLSSRAFVIVQSVKITFALQCVSAFFGIVGLQPPTSYTQPIFPFTEASHLALVFTPLLLFLCVTTRGLSRLMFLGIGLAVALLLKSLTMFVGLTLIVVICTRGLFLPAVAIFAATVGSLLNITYYTSRLTFDNSQNLSALVFIQGWQLLFQAFDKSHGWGIGFQQFGLHDAHTDASDIIYLIAGNDVNLLDGGITVAKFVGEFGFFGIAATFFFVYVAARSFMLLKRTIQGRVSLPIAQIFACCFLVTYPIELFVRGLGYFTPTFLLVFASLQITFVTGRPRVINAGRRAAVPAGLPTLRV